MASCRHCPTPHRWLWHLGVGNWPHLQWVIIHILRHDGVDLSTIVQESNTTLPFILTLAMFSAPYHCWKGSRFKKGVCGAGFMPWEPLSGGSSWHWLLSEGSRLPSPMLSPPCHLTVSFPWKSLQAGNCRWNVPGCYSGSSISHLLGYPLQPLPSEP